MGRRVTKIPKARLRKINTLLQLVETLDGLEAEGRYEETDGKTSWSGWKERTREEAS